MKKPRKKYDAITARRKMIQEAWRNVMVRKIHGHDPLGLPLHIRTGKPVAMPLDLVNALVQMPCKWLIVLLVWGKESNGKNHLDSLVIRTKPLSQLDLNEYLTEQLVAMHDRAKYQISTDGYAAMPVPPEYVDDLTDDLLCIRIKELIDKPEYYNRIEENELHTTARAVEENV